MKQNVLVAVLAGGLAVGAFVLRAGRRADPHHAPLEPASTRQVEIQPPIDLTLNPPVHPEERDNTPKRIISLAPSITQTCFALGLGGQLVGRTQYCVHPPAAKKIPTVGALVDPKLEVIVDLKPDLVLVTTTSSTQLTDRLLELDLPVKQIPDSNLEDIFTALRQVGELTGRIRTAASAIKILRAELERLSQAAPRRQPAPRVLVVTGPLPIPPRAVWVAGPGSYLDEIVRLAHCRNALTNLSKPWGEVSLETIARADPDYILESRDDASAKIMDQVYAGWSALGSLGAVRHQRIRSIPWEDLVIPSPRVNVTLYEVIRLLAS